MNPKNTSLKAVGSLLFVGAALLAHHVAVRSEPDRECVVTPYEDAFPAYCLPPRLELSLLPSSTRVSDKEDFAKADGYTIFVDIALLGLGYLALRQTKK